LERKDLARMILGLLGRIGELDPARLHAPAGEDLRLDHRWPADALGDLARLRGVGREAVVGDGDAGALYDLARLVLEEPHAGGKPTRRGASFRLLAAARRLYGRGRRLVGTRRREPVCLGQLWVLAREHFGEDD